MAAAEPCASRRTEAVLGQDGATALGQDEADEVAATEASTPWDVPDEPEPEDDAGGDDGGSAKAPSKPAEEAPKEAPAPSAPSVPAFWSGLGLPLAKANVVSASDSKLVVKHQGKMLKVASEYGQAILGKGYKRGSFDKASKTGTYTKGGETITMKVSGTGTVTVTLSH